MSDKTFTSGKYYGKTHKEIAAADPQYIVDSYEMKQDNGGISNEIYRLASINIEEAVEAEQYVSKEEFQKEVDEEGF